MVRYISGASRVKKKLIQWSTPTLIKAIIVAIPVGIFAIVIYTVVTVYYAPDVTTNQIKSLALTFARKRCQLDNKDNSFCNNLRVTIGSRNYDPVGDTWSIYVRGDNAATHDNYAGFLIQYDDSGLHAVEKSYSIIVSNP